jgi:hypothetical protein
MKTWIFLLVIFLIISVTTCKEDTTNFCYAVEHNDYLKVAEFANDYCVNKQNQKQSDEELINDLANWFRRQSCVDDVEILCVNCNDNGFPGPYSRITIMFNGAGGYYMKTAWITMDIGPLCIAFR